MILSALKITTAGKGRIPEVGLFNRGGTPLPQEATPTRIRSHRVQSGFNRGGTPLPQEAAPTGRRSHKVQIPQGSIRVQSRRDAAPTGRRSHRKPLPRHGCESGPCGSGFQPRLIKQNCRISILKEQLVAGVMSCGSGPCGSGVPPRSNPTFQTTNLEI